MIETFVVDKYDSSSVGEQIATYLSKKISNKEIAPGRRLPSVREMTKTLNVGNHTVQQALDILRKNGLVKTTNKGTFISMDSPSNVLGSNSQEIETVRRDFALLIPSAWRPRDAAIVDGISVGINKNCTDRQLVIFNTEADVSKQADSIIQIIDREFAGVILITPVEQQTPAHHVRILQKNNIPVVLCHRGVDGCQAPIIRFNAVKVGNLAAEMIADKGHTQVAYLSVYPYSTSLDMERGFRERLKDYGIELYDDNVYYQEHTDTYGNEKELLDAKSKAIERILKKKDRPTAIFCFDSSAEVLIYLIANNLGLTIPDDLSIVRTGYNASDCIISSQITSILSDPKLVGQTAAKILNEICEAKRSMYNSEVIDVPLSFELRSTLNEFNQGE